MRLAVAAHLHGLPPGVRIAYSVQPMVASVVRSTANGHECYLPEKPSAPKMSGMISFAYGADDELDSTVSAVAQQVASASAATVAIGKRAFYEQLGLSTEQAYAKMSDVMATTCYA